MIITAQGMAEHICPTCKRPESNTDIVRYCGVCGRAVILPHTWCCLHCEPWTRLAIEITRARMWTGLPCDHEGM